jgi:hypothetical protein
MAAVEAAYYRKLFRDEMEPGTERLSLAFPPKDVTEPPKVTEVKPIPKRLTNRKVMDDLGRTD